MTILDNTLRDALDALLSELADGSGSEAAWILNPNDPGLLASLDRLSAAAASAVPSNGGSPIAAHVEHLCYGLGLLNRWSEGENPFEDADYARSWRKRTVTEPEWAALRDELKNALQRWRGAVRQQRDLTPIEVTGTLASVAHLAYHLGAIRQIDRAIRGPSASD